MKSLNKIWLLMLKAFPFVLFFSYYPLIRLGGDESMNFELSLPILWLVGFDVIGGILLVREKVLFEGLRGKKWWWLLFPMWLTLSVFWSSNVLRGVLTAGLLWLVCLGGYEIWVFRKKYDEGFRQQFLKWLIGGTLVVCAWCILQCVLDLCGVSKENSLMCAGCTYHSFGFPHPNGFAIEPQFMGNLLLAPVIIVSWLLISWQDHKKPELKFCLFIISATLFLTFSRGAIYAFIVAMLFMTGYYAVRKDVRKMSKKMLLIWVMIVGSFLFTLNMQGLMAAVGPTSDNYVTGVTKALNHLSLGIIDIRGEVEENGDLQGNEVVEKPVENFVENDRETEVPAYDGYVAESTDIRVGLTNAALTVWSSDFRNLTIGVGLGGAGVSLQNAGLMPTSKEIVQNQYASLLLETGLVGVSLSIMVLVLMIRAVGKLKTCALILSLMVAYGVSLLFFAGLPNALHIYLLPIMLMAIIK